jgi:predicted metal-dependent enzyme (double-stranded beta helix superfamily)
VGAVSEQTVAERLEHLHAISNLDWGLIANLTGVSLNAIYFARAGKRMHPRAVERLDALICLVKSSPATTPEERHEWMFQVIDGGNTRVQWFSILGRSNRVPLQGSGYSPAQLLGAQIDGV